jgi:hypothetical protein
VLRSLPLGSFLIAAALTVLPNVAEAKCFAFRGQTIRVCVDGDNNASRRAATEICGRISGQPCSVSGYSGSCQRSSSVRCYDARGQERRSIDSE